MPLPPYRLRKPRPPCRSRRKRNGIDQRSKAWCLREVRFHPKDLGALAGPRSVRHPPLPRVVFFDAVRAMMPQIGANVRGRVRLPGWSVGSDVDVMMYGGTAAGSTPAPPSPVQLSSTPPVTLHKANARERSNMEMVNDPGRRLLPEPESQKGKRNRLGTKSAERSKVCLGSDER